MDDCITITLLRHGLTEENTHKKFIGWTNSSLSREGRSKLVHLTQSTYPVPDYIVCSDLKRCVETYNILYSTSHIPTIYSSHWRELSFGDWEQKSHDELYEDAEYRKWLQAWKKVQIPNGENYEAFNTRVNKGIREIKNLFQTSSIKHILIITHCGPIRIMRKIAATAATLGSSQVLFRE